MILESVAWIVFIVFGNLILAVFWSDPLRGGGHGFWETFKGVFVLEAIVLAIFGFVYSFTWSITYLFFRGVS